MFVSKRRSKLKPFAALVCFAVLAACNDSELGEAGLGPVRACVEHACIDPDRLEPELEVEFAQAECTLPVNVDRECISRVEFSSGPDDTQLPWDGGVCLSPSSRHCAPVTKRIEGGCHELEISRPSITCALEVLRDGVGEFELIEENTNCGGADRVATRYRAFERDGRRLVYARRTWYRQLGDDRVEAIETFDGVVPPSRTRLDACLEAAGPTQWACIEDWEMDCDPEPAGCGCE